MRAASKTNATLTQRYGPCVHLAGLLRLDQQVPLWPGTRQGDPSRRATQLFQQEAFHKKNIHVYNLRNPNTLKDEEISFSSLV